MTKLHAVFHPIYSQLALPKNHRFPIEKYASLQRLTQSIWPEHIAFHQPNSPVIFEQLQTIHETNYITDFIAGELPEKAMKRIGFPWTEQFKQRTLTAVAGTILAADLAYQHDFAVNLTGGYHHAHPDFGSGFCVFNDLALAADMLIEQGKASRILIFDCDVHQGDGTAAVCAHRSDIFTLSIHCEKNFPARKSNSDWDIGLDKHLTDQAYLDIMQDALDTAISSFKPDFIIYDAGADIHIDDDLGLLNVSTEGVFKRDLQLLSTAKKMNLPVLAVIGGGYQRDIEALTQVHLQLFEAAIKTYLPKE